MLAVPQGHSGDASGKLGVAAATRRQWRTVCRSRVLLACVAGACVCNARFVRTRTRAVRSCGRGLVSRGHKYERRAALTRQKGHGGRMLGAYLCVSLRTRVAMGIDLWCVGASVYIKYCMLRAQCYPYYSSASQECAWRGLEVSQYTVHRLVPTSHKRRF